MNIARLSGLIVALAVLAAAWTNALAAKDKDKEPERVKTTGTVTHVDLEGGFWAIKGDGGKKYDPLGSLPKEFRKEGLKVRFEATVQEGAVSTHMWGKIIKIAKIEKVEQ